MDELSVLFGNYRYTAQPGQVLTIGRSAASDVVVDDPRVSREHIRISCGPEGWTADSVGRGGTYLAGQPVRQFHVGEALRVHLAAVDGPEIAFELAMAPARPVEETRAVPGGAAVGPPSPGAVGAMAIAGGPAPMPPSGALTSDDLVGALRMLIPVKGWPHDRSFRQWLRVLVALYAIVPLILLAVVFKSSLDLEAMGWAYCLYVAPLWAIVFWFLIRPGRIVLVDMALGVVIIAAELVLIPAVTIPWEQALAPGATNHDLFQWIYGVGLAEELTKALPIMVLALLLLKVWGKKLDVRMWMYLGTISGLMFGVYEASTNYVPGAFTTAAASLAKGIVTYINTTSHATIQGVAGFISADGALGIPSFAERVFLDGFQHALWVGVAAFFIGLGANYARQRVLLWTIGLALPAVLHGLNDWAAPSQGAFGANPWPWIAIQAFSVFLFLGYTVSARSIERQVRRTPLFRGDSIAFDSSLQPPPVEQPNPA